MRVLKVGDIVEVDGAIAVVVGTAEDLTIPEDHVALWFGEPRCTRISNGGTGGARPEVWTVPVEYCTRAMSAEFRH
jgi:hypothetical protein